LALALGKTVRQLLAEISSAELNEWRAYSMLEPFGEQLADLRHGIALSALANLHRDPKRRREPYRPEDFIPWHLAHRAAKAESESTLLADPEAQSRLIKQLFRRDR
jgi:hypothetical protein